MKIITKIIMLLAVAMLISTMAIATASASPDIKSDKTKTGISIESKEKKVSYKITWNSNGGKIGTKKTKITTVKKGSKIGKLVATPKKSRYKFSGWYTKKTGGAKISKNTVPKKNMVYYAKWTRKSKADSKLIGTWRDYNNIFIFNKNGKFAYFYSYYGSYGLVMSKTEGKYKATNGKIYFTNIVYERGGSFEKHHKNTVFEYKFGKDNEGEYLFIPNIFSDNKPYLDISSATKLRKS